jgi:hypothetical protein
MKKFSIIIIIICLLLTGITVQAQKLYIRAGVGIAASTSGYFVTKSTSSNGYELKKAGIGTGLPVVVAAGYKLGENVSVELGINYFQGFNVKSLGTQYYNGVAIQDATTKVHGTMLSIVPAVVLTIPLEKLQPYARFGIKVGVMNSLITKIDGTTNEYGTELKATSSVKIKEKDHGGIAFGAQAAVGTAFKLSEMLALFAELQMDGISYAPTKGKITELSVNGEDQLGQMASEDKSWDYSRSRTDGDNKQDKFNIPFNNFGLVFGVKIKLGS